MLRANPDQLHMMFFVRNIGKSEKNTTMYIIYK